MKKIYVFIVIFFCILFYSDLYSQNWVHLSNSRLGIPSDDDVYTITQDTSGFYWLGTYLGNVVLLLDTNKFLTIGRSEKNINKFDLRKSSVDKYNNVWFLNQFDLMSTGTTWKRFRRLNDTVNLLTYNYLLEDTNKIWLLGTDGIYYYKNSNLTKYDTSYSFVKENISRNIKKDKNGIIWILNERGIIKINNEEFSRIDFSKSEFPDSLNNVLRNDFSKDMAFDSNNNLWVATFQNGLFKYNGTSWTRYHTGNSNISSNRLYDIEIDSNNVVWIASSNGLIEFDGVNWTNYNSSNSDLTTNRTVCLFIDKKNNKYIGTALEGLFVFNENGYNLTKVEETSKKENIPLYPNPVDKYFNMSFEIKHNANLVIDIYDITGNKISNALNELRPIGTTEFNYDVSKLQNGTYILKLSNGPWSESIKFVVNR